MICTIIWYDGNENQVSKRELADPKVPEEFINEIKSKDWYQRGEGDISIEAVILGDVPVVLFDADYFKAYIKEGQNESDERNTRR